MVTSFSIRTILGIIIGMMSILGIILALVSGIVHRELTFDNNRKMLAEMISINTDELLEDLKVTSQDLGLALQSSAEFRQAMRTQDKEALTQMLNNQFHQYFVTAGVIKLEHLYLLDKNLDTITASTEGLMNHGGHTYPVCLRMLEVARARKGRLRLAMLSDQCLHQGRPMHAVMVPVGGLRLKGYLVIMTDPLHSLIDTESALGMPVRLSLANQEVVYQSKTWPTGKAAKDVFYASHISKSPSGVPLYSIEIAHDLSSLSENLLKTRFVVLLYACIGTLAVVLFAAWLLRKTTVRPLSRLTGMLHQIHTDRSLMGQQLEVTGTTEIRDLTIGFNEMSRELGNLYQTLEQMAYTDSLTNLPNRNMFQNQLEKHILIYHQTQQPFALFLMDLDRFKSVNDTLGHHVGDLLLQEVSNRLQQTLRKDDIISRVDKEFINDFEGDMVARLGGDEFAAVFSSVSNIDDAIIIARKILRAMEQSFNVDEHRLTISVSIGIVVCPEHGNDVHTLISHADVAMYHAKNRKCGFSVYETEQDRHSLHFLKLEQDLFAAIKKGELELHYQPKIVIQDGTVFGAEALVRWRHPEHGLIPPDEFIPLAEQTGLIHPLTNWVVNKALEDCAEYLRTEMTQSISVNLSALNLMDQDITTSISEALDRWSVPPASLVLELTESTIMSNPEHATEVLKRLDEMGISLSIDDFGTGYSSLAYIKHLPVDELKIDKSFVQEITRDSNDEAIVRAVLVLAHHMKLTVVAEGVEDAQTLQMLRELGCDIAQGYYFAKPMPIEEYRAWLKKYNTLHAVPSAG